MYICTGVNPTITSETNSSLLNETVVGLAPDLKGFDPRHDGRSDGDLQPVDGEGAQPRSGEGGSFQKL
jgi:hypothetical protein